MNNILYIFLIFLASCKNGKDKKDISNIDVVSRYYKDINIFKLQGIDELSGLAYPCIEIKNLDKKRIITYHSDKGQKSIQEYFYSDSAWLSKSQLKGDTSMIYSYEFILPDKVLTYNYTDTSVFKLMDITVIKGNKETSFSPGEDLNVPPTIQNFNMVVEKSKVSYMNEIVEGESALIVKEVKVNQKGQTVFNQTTCFEPKKCSYFWWIYFGPSYLKKTQCK